MSVKETQKCEVCGAIGPTQTIDAFGITGEVCVDHIACQKRAIAMQQKLTSIKVVHWTDLDNHHLWESADPLFDDVSWGDAEYTLVHPHQLCSEIESRKDCVDHDVQPLIGELLSVPDGVLIALNG